MKFHKRKRFTELQELYNGKYRVVVVGIEPWFWGLVYQTIVYYPCYKSNSLDSRSFISNWGTTPNNNSVFNSLEEARCFMRKVEDRYIVQDVYKIIDTSIVGH